LAQHGLYDRQDYIARWGTDLKGVVLSGTAGVFPNLDALVAMAEQAAQSAAAEPSAVFGQMFASFNTPFAPAKTGFEWLSRDELKCRNMPTIRGADSRSATSGARFHEGAADMWQPDKRHAFQEPAYPDRVRQPRPGGGNTGHHALIERYKSNGIQDLAFKFYPERGMKS